MVESSTKLADGFSTMLLNMGLPGLCLLVLGYVVYRMAIYIRDVQEKRVTETQTTTTALNSSAAALNRLSDILLRQHRES